MPQSKCGGISNTDIYFRKRIQQVLSLLERPPFFCMQLLASTISYLLCKWYIFSNINCEKFTEKRKKKKKKKMVRKFLMIFSYNLFFNPSISRLFFSKNWDVFSQFLI